ncbi:hypothetical protein FQA39_LY18592 [Lamprigera yunnana]|nr:hypothetical protein FQA39_LY18592 [Lamprigera yunnana]
MELRPQRHARAWDWELNDPEIHSTTWEWDMGCPGVALEDSHNFACTRVQPTSWGKDLVRGHGVLRVTRDEAVARQAAQRSSINNISSELTFEWGLALHDIELAEAIAGNKPWPQTRRQLRELGIKVLARAVGRLPVYPASVPVVGALRANPLSEPHRERAGPHILDLSPGWRPPGVQRRTSSSARSGVAVSTLHFYERESDLGPAPPRATNGGTRGDAAAGGFIRISHRVGIPLPTISDGPRGVADGRTPTKADWERLSRHWPRPITPDESSRSPARQPHRFIPVVAVCPWPRARLANPHDALRPRGIGPRRVFNSSGRSQFTTAGPTIDSQCRVSTYTYAHVGRYAVTTDSGVLAVGDRRGG